jgi:hypothetical protein
MPQTPEWMGGVEALHDGACPSSTSPTSVPATHPVTDIAEDIITSKIKTIWAMIE